MGVLRSRDKGEVREIARGYAQSMGVPWMTPVTVKRTGLRKWRVTSAGEYAGGRSEIVVDDRSGDVDDIKIAC